MPDIFDRWRTSLTHRRIGISLVRLCKGDRRGLLNGLAKPLLFTGTLNQEFPNVDLGGQINLGLVEVEWQRQRWHHGVLLSLLEEGLVVELYLLHTDGVRLEREGDVAGSDNELTRAVVLLLANHVLGGTSL
jgi:hypothetical protein